MVHGEASVTVRHFQWRENHTTAVWEGDKISMNDSFVGTYLRDRITDNDFQKHFFCVVEDIEYS